ncbi:Beta-glucosidase 47 [Citrus sinensis]|nr:Beta-glucosidase 47 [Citrus sinensis]
MGRRWGFYLITVPSPNKKVGKKLSVSSPNKKLGIQPFVTLTHYDIPQELEDRYGAWLSREVQEDFEYYADICFKYFGDRVKYWATFNEPNVVVIRGYQSGIYPPSRCSGLFGNCTNGDSEKEPFIAAHNIILSHAAAVKIYRTKYQKEQEGNIGIVMNVLWLEPMSNSLEDKLAAERAQAFYLNWFLDPIIFGKYPKEMYEILGSSLPSFSKNDLEKLKNGLDFIGINHYTSFYVKDCIFSVCEPGPGNCKTEGSILRTAKRNGVLIGEPTDVDWLFVYPQGMSEIVTYIKERYNNIPMYITENDVTVVGREGFGERDNPHTSIEDLLNDTRRVRNGADVRGYFAWSLLDNFEWNDGYTIRFGLHHVDYATLKRTKRLSANWYKQYIAKHMAGKWSSASA